MSLGQIITSLVKNLGFHKGISLQPGQQVSFLIGMENINGDHSCCTSLVGRMLRILNQLLEM